MKLPSLIPIQKPFDIGHGFIEKLNHEKVAGALVDFDLTTGDALGNLFGGADGAEDILTAAEDEGGAFDLTEAIKGVVFEAGMGGVGVTVDGAIGVAEGLLEGVHLLFIFVEVGGREKGE